MACIVNLKNHGAGVSIHAAAAITWTIQHPHDRIAIYEHEHQHPLDVLVSQSRHVESNPSVA